MIRNIKLYATAFLKWLCLALLIGAVSGLLGALFLKTIESVTAFRENHSWIIYLLPIGGLLSVAIYKLCRVNNIGTNQVFESVRSESTVSPLLAPAVFFGTAITHLFGGSAGREGAALQLGGSIAQLFAKIFKLNSNTTHILTVCGMSGFFSAVFGTPVGACVFALEVVTVGHFTSAAVFPAMIASITAKAVATILGVKAESFPLTDIPDFSVKTLVFVLIIAIATALISVLFCYTMRFSAKLFKKYFKNDFIRIFIGGAVIVLLTVILGTNDYNGGGISVIERIFAEGEFRYEAFIIKIIFTAVTIGAGFKGGEIIPTMFIGATFGAALSVILGLNPAFCAAVGVAAMFCGVTNCPLATIFLCTEMFGANGMVFFAISAVVSFLLSGHISLYSGQKIVFSKLTEEVFEK